MIHSDRGKHPDTYDRSVNLAEISGISLLALYDHSIGWVIHGGVVSGILHGAFTNRIGVALALVKFLVHQHTIGPVMCIVSDTIRDSMFLQQ